ncbi:MAG: c-type cytochrome biogenesis protein CcsB [Deltaproteobacteria bacterium]|jgi:cytochrome c-type biogenesis protein CcsB|nr:c-type cytochrome biogenesis protein CcsB [Deltaproteobacteria bacterium]
MESVFLVIATLCYCLGTVGYLIYLVRDWTPVHRTSWWILFIGVIFHGISFALRSFQEEHLAVTSSAEALSFFALVLVSTYLIVQVRLQLRILGSFVSPLAVIFMLASTLLPSHIIPKSGIFQSGWVVLHVSTLFLANALFALAFSAGVMYLLQERHIKHKSFGYLYNRLPSLDRLDTINYFCLIIGFPLMTVGLVVGFAYAGNIWRSPWNWDPKEIFALITWIIYAILLHERLTVGWRGRRAAWMAIFGFSLVLVTFLGVNLFLKGHHTVFVR